VTDKKEDKSTWAIGGGVLVGIGVGFFFLQKSLGFPGSIPGGALSFVGSLLAGLGLGLIITAIISSKK
jgi:hypothetical protein